MLLLLVEAGLGRVAIIWFARQRRTVEVDLYTHTRSVRRTGAPNGSERISRNNQYNQITNRWHQVAPVAPVAPVASMSRPLPSLPVAQPPVAEVVEVTVFEPDDGADGHANGHANGSANGSALPPLCRCRNRGCSKLSVRGRHSYYWMSGCWITATALLYLALSCGRPDPKQPLHILERPQPHCDMLKGMFGLMAAVLVLTPSMWVVYLCCARHEPSHRLEHGGFCSNQVRSAPAHGAHGPPSVGLKPGTAPPRDHSTVTLRVHYDLGPSCIMHHPSSIILAPVHLDPPPFPLDQCNLSYEEQMTKARFIAAMTNDDDDSML